LAEKDQFQNLTLRTTFSGGLGYQIFETARAKASTEAAVGYVNEHFVDTSPTITPTSRLALRWEYGLVPERLVLWQRTEGYYDLGGGNALRVRSDQGVRITLYKNLFFNLEEDFRYNSQPAPGRKSTDSAVIFGVGYALD
jgi:putative salt-induced outer membrane protein YdiY